MNEPFKPGDIVVGKLGTKVRVQEIRGNYFRGKVIEDTGSYKAGDGSPMWDVKAFTFLKRETPVIDQIMEALNTLEQKQKGGT
jgi:hypothetical protein